MEPDAVDEAVYDDGVAPYPRIERRKPREAQKLLRLVQRGPEAEAQADEARARGVPTLYATQNTKHFHTNAKWDDVTKMLCVLCFLKECEFFIPTFPKLRMSYPFRL